LTNGNIDVILYYEYKKGCAKPFLRRHMLDYKVIRSRRKTAAIYIREDGSVEVRCPLNYSAGGIERFVSDNREKLEILSAKRAAEDQKRKAFKVKEQDSLRLMGKEYPLIKTGGNKASFDGKAFYLPQKLWEEEAKHALVKLYKSLAKEIIGKKVEHFSKIMDLKPGRISINSAKSRWGSCGAKDSLNFSWRLIRAKEECLDYVIIHELAHIKHRNHSPYFWNLVAEYCPGYKRAKALLFEEQKRLACENWD